MIRASTRVKVLEAIKTRERDRREGRLFSCIADQALYNPDGTEAVIYKTIWLGRSCYEIEIVMDGSEPKIERRH